MGGLVCSATARSPIAWAVACAQLNGEALYGLVFFVWGSLYADSLSRRMAISVSALFCCVGNIIEISSNTVWAHVRPYGREGSRGS
jgi:hypothetical protein